MRNNAILKKGKSKFISVLLLTLLLILSSVCAVACAEVPDEEDAYDPEFTFSEKAEETGLVPNSDFTLGLTEVANDAYPVNSVNGWSFTSDNGAISSAVKSGVVNTDADMWKKAIVTLLDDEDFLNYVKDEYTSVDFTDKSDEEIADAIISATDGFSAPARPDADKNVLMVNNISSKTTADKIGTAQSVSSTSSITLEKNECAKISVFVNTHKKLKGNSADFGANIRVSTTINSITQAQYAVENIITDGAWKEYVIYVKGNNYTSSSISISLGLGFGDKTGNYLDYAYGVAYFDNVTVTKADRKDDTADFTQADFDSEISALTATNSSLSSLTYNGAPDAKRVTAGTADKFLYDLSFDLDAYLTATDTKIAGDNSFAEGAKDSFKVTSYDTTSVANGVKVTVNKQVASFKLTKADGSNFAVTPEGFATVKFSVKNDLSNYSKDGVKIYLVDENSNSAKPNKTLIANANQTEEDDGFTTYTVTVKNNFPDNTTGDRSFYFLIVVGVTNPQEYTANTFFPSGDVIVKDLTYLADTVENKENDRNYLYVESLSSGNLTTFGTYALYAGNGEDYVEEDDEVTYNIKVSELNKHNIKTQIVDAVDYTGVVANHRYVVENGEETAVNTSETAGVINSENLANYTALPNLATALGTVTEEDGIQPLVIYNATADSYGFIGKSSKLAKSSTAKITLKVKVDATASAYIYIVNMNNDEDKLNVYTHKVNDKTNTLAVKVTNTNGQWKTVSFYIASGADDMNYRIEMWNGARDGLSGSEGYVFVNDIEISTFTENEEKNGHLVTGSVLKAALDDNEIEYASATDNAIKNGVLHTRALTELEKQFNEEYPDQKVEYAEKYVWVSNKNDAGEGSFVYAIYNTINPVTTDPYDSITPEEEEEVEEESGCGADFDSATFWLQFSTILLAVLLVGSVLLLVLRTIRRRTKKASKIKARYNVKSRNQTLSKLEKAKQERLARAKAEAEEKANAEEEVENSDLVNTVDGDDDNDDTEYTYGEVLEDFGDDVVVDGNEVELPESEEVNEETTEVSEETPAEGEEKQD